MKEPSTTPVKKASLYAIIINALQILCAGAAAAYILFWQKNTRAEPVEIAAVMVLFGIVTLGAVLDIIEASATFDFPTRTIPSPPMP